MTSHCPLSDKERKTSRIVLHLVSSVAHYPVQSIERVLPSLHLPHRIALDQDKEKICCFDGQHQCHIPGGSLGSLSIQVKKEPHEGFVLIDVLSVQWGIMMRNSKV